ncbi:MAG: rhodanese-like domain-containing protein [Alphaproteobacteria bacterium]|nr:rhodanese-like domain-containing protein [Alphaproteobacteria bacterium]
MTALKTYTAQQVRDLLKQDVIVLVDVREPDEHACECIEGAVLCPLSTFDPAKLPPAGDKEIVLHCAGGVRSAKALACCLGEGKGATAHMEGGIKAWKNAGLPTTKP